MTDRSRVVADQHDPVVRGRDGSVEMTHHNSSNSEPQKADFQTPRLRLKPKAPVAGFVDGAWWPHTDDLAAELPDLLAVLSVRLGPIDRVLYHLGEWSTAAAKIAIRGRSVHLDGYWNQPPNSIQVLGMNRSALALLVVSPHTDPQRAHTTMMAAAGRANISTVEQLLPNMEVHNPIDPGAASAAAQTRWESEGGAGCDHLVAAGSAAMTLSPQRDRSRK
jgi:hypothetical protein